MQGDLSSWFIPTYVTQSLPRLLVRRRISIFSLMIIQDFLKEISEVFEVFKKFKVMVEKTTNLYIKTLRYDRGKECMSITFTNYYEEQGIKISLTTPYSP